MTPEKAYWSWMKHHQLPELTDEVLILSYCFAKNNPGWDASTRLILEEINKRKTRGGFTDELTAELVRLRLEGYAV